MFVCSRCASVTLCVCVEQGYASVCLCVAEMCKCRFMCLC